MPDAPAHSELPAPVDERPIDFDRPCRVCGYNLRTLLPSAVCPECGAPVIDSLPEHVLGRCGTAWLESFGVGLERVHAATLFYILTPFIIPGFLMAAALDTSASIVVAGLLFAPTVLRVTGIWRLTAPDSLGMLGDEWRRAARHARLTHVIDAAGVTLAILSCIWQPTRHLAPLVVFAYVCLRFQTHSATARFTRHVMSATGAAIVPRSLTRLVTGHYLLNGVALVVAAAVCEATTLRPRSSPSIAEHVVMTIPPIPIAFVMTMVVLTVGLAALSLHVIRRLDHIVTAARARASRIRAGCNSAVAERIASQIETLD